MTSGGDGIGVLPHLDDLRAKTSKAKAAAQQAYEFGAGSYTYSVLQEIIGLEIAMERVLAMLEAER
jgi:hypothetical protein